MTRQTLITLYLMVICCSSLTAQDFTSPERDESQVVVRAPIGYLDAFWADCKGLKRGETAVVIHLGDSHVQAGFFSQPIRTGFDHLFGVAGTGWAGGYSLARTNQPIHIKVRAERSAHYRTSIITSRHYVGDSPTGMVITSTAKGDQRLSFSSTDGSPISRVIVFRPSTSEPPVYEHTFSLPRSHKMELLPSDVTDTINITNPSATVTLTVPGKSVFYGISLEQELGGVVLHTIGYNGAYYGTYADNGFGKKLPLLRPKLIIISLGTNDGLVNHFSSDNFQASVRSLIRQIRTSCPQTAIVLTSALPSRRHTSRRRRRRASGAVSPNMKTIATDLKRVAEEEKVGFIDLYQVFGGDKKYASLKASGFYSHDGIHLSREGYTECGQAIADALNKDFRRYLREKEH